MNFVMPSWENGLNVIPPMALLLTIPMTDAWLRSKTNLRASARRSYPEWYSNPLGTFDSEMSCTLKVLNKK